MTSSGPLTAIREASQASRIITKGYSDMTNLPATSQQMEATPDDGLNVMQRDFAEAWLTAKFTQAEAAIEAGYAPNHAASMASRLLRHDKVVAYIAKAMQQTLVINGPRAIANTVLLSNDAKSEYVRLEASKDLADRAGLGATKKVDARILGDVSFHLDLS